jgi:hypothetical protein
MSPLHLLSLAIGCLLKIINKKGKVLPLILKYGGSAGAEERRDHLFEKDWMNY